MNQNLALIDHFQLRFLGLKDLDEFNCQRREGLLPEELYPKGLSAERQWYLYQQIREHISNDQDKNSTCPKPIYPKPKGPKLN